MSIEKNDYESEVSRFCRMQITGSLVVKEDIQLTATNVPGRKAMLMTAIVRIAKLSSFVVFAILVDIFAIFRLSLLSRCATRL
jgi:hypothetical protein